MLLLLVVQTSTRHIDISTGGRAIATGMGEKRKKNKKKE